MQRELTEGPLHNEDGTLAEAGWARADMRRYARAAIKAPWYRIKEWDYYCVLGPEYGLALVIADNSYMSLQAMTWLDLKGQQLVDATDIGLLSRGKLGMPSSPDTGDLSLHGKKMDFDFEVGDGFRRLTFNCPGFDRGKGAVGQVTLSQPPMDRMVIATPFEGRPHAFYYNQKINCMAASGRITIGDDTYMFRREEHFAVLDWGRGVWPYDNLWYWGSASGIANGKPFGFNIGHGFGDTSAATENMVFVDGRAHKLDQVTWAIPPEGYTAAPWIFSSNDGRFEVTFEPMFDRDNSVNLGFLHSIPHQVFGKFSGTVILDDGTPFAFTDVMGFAEEVANRW